MFVVPSLGKSSLYASSNFLYANVVIVTQSSKALLPTIIEFFIHFHAHSTNVDTNDVSLDSTSVTVYLSSIATTSSSSSFEVSIASICHDIYFYLFNLLVTCIFHLRCGIATSTTNNHISFYLSKGEYYINQNSLLPNLQCKKKTSHKLIKESTINSNCISLLKQNKRSTNIC
jgi:hypothetical protein